MSNERFDLAAATWDEQPSRIALAREVAAGISREIELNSRWDVLDFGCGTGLLALQLLPTVRSVTGVDSSGGMLDVFKQKITKLANPNVRAHFFDYRADELAGRYDLVVSSMVFHHVENIPLLLKKLRAVILPGAYIAVADLDWEGGRFHDNSTGVFHLGFDRERIKDLFLSAGFTEIKVSDCTKLAKPGSDGALQDFTVFLLTARNI